MSSFEAVASERVERILSFLQADDREILEAHVYERGLKEFDRGYETARTNGVLRMSVLYLLVFAFFCFIGSCLGCYVAFVDNSRPAVAPESKTVQWYRVHEAFPTLHYSNIGDFDCYWDANSDAFFCVNTKSPVESVPAEIPAIE